MRSTQPSAISLQRRTEEHVEKFSMIRKKNLAFALFSVYSENSRMGAAPACGGI